MLADVVFQNVMRVAAMLLHDGDYQRTLSSKKMLCMRKERFCEGAGWGSWGREVLGAMAGKSSSSARPTLGPWSVGGENSPAAPVSRTLQKRFDEGPRAGWHNGHVVRGAQVAWAVVLFALRVVVSPARR